MGRGDKRTAKGKRTKGSFGNSRKQKRVTVKTAVKSNPDAPAKKTAAKKAQAKKAPAKKAAAKKEAGEGGGE